MSLGADRALGREEVVGDRGLQHVHIGLVVVLAVEDRRAIAGKVIGLDAHAARLLLDGLEEVEVVDGGVPVEHLEQLLAADNKEVDKGGVALVRAALEAGHAAFLGDEGDDVVIVARGGLDDGGDVGVIGLVSSDELVVVHVVDKARGAHDHVLGVGALEEGLVGDHVAHQEASARTGGAKGGAGQHEEAALLAGEAPVLAGAHVVGERTVVERHHDTDRGDLGVDHVGQREVDQAVTAEVRKRRHRAALSEGARVFGGVISGNVANRFCHGYSSSFPTTTSSPMTA